MIKFQYFYLLKMKFGLGIGSEIEKNITKQIEIYEFEILLSKSSYNIQMQKDLHEQTLFV